MPPPVAAPSNSNAPAAPSNSIAPPPPSNAPPLPSTTLNV